MQQGGLVKALFESFMTNPFRKLLTLVIKFFHRIDVRCQELRRHTHPTAVTKSGPNTHPPTISMLWECVH